MSKIRKFFTGAISVLLLSGFVISPAMGQQAQQKQSPPQPQMQQQRQQTDIQVSDQELHTFADAIHKAQTIQQSAQSQMVKAIKDEGLTLDEYKQIVQSTHQSQQGQNSQPDISKKKMEEARSASQAVGKIQSQTQQKVVKAIQGEGMQPKRFQQILTALRNDKDLQARYQGLNSTQNN